jgi:hemerythrin-like metal-binding protein
LPLIKLATKTEQSSLVKWDPAFSVGITEIDQQHQMLIAMINELQSSVQAGRGRDAQGKILDGLSAYARDHFANEERLFGIYAYPWSISHKAEHQAFTQKVASFIQDYKVGKSDVSSQILTFLSDWLKNHIVSKDKTYSYFFAMKGLK